jgi:hypothetical protein
MGKFTSYKILPEQKLIICNYQGGITIKDVIQLTQIFIADKDFNPAYNVFIDFRNSTAIGFGLDVADYISFFKKSVTVIGKVQVGILYSTPNQEYLLKIYKGLGKLINLDVENFRSIDPCLEWMHFLGDQKELVISELNFIKSTSEDFLF